MSSASNKSIAVTEQKGITLDPREAEYIANTQELDREATEVARALVAPLATSNMKSEEFRAHLNDIVSLGSDEIIRSTMQNNRILERASTSAASAMRSDKARKKAAGNRETGAMVTVSKNLMELRDVVDLINPADSPSVGKRMLSMIPFGNKVQKFVHRYESSASTIQKIVESLADGKEGLMRDNSDIQVDLANKADSIRALIHDRAVLQRVEREVEDVARGFIENGDADRANSFRANVIHKVKQKIFDLNTQIAVALQGAQSLEFIRENNIELMENVDRVNAVTIPALSTSVTIAQTLDNQDRMVSSIKKIREVTDKTMKSNSERLLKQATQIQRSSSESMVSIDTLRESFRNISEAISQVENERIKSIEILDKQSRELEAEIAKTQTKMDNSLSNVDVMGQIGTGAASADDLARLKGDSSKNRTVSSVGGRYI